LPLSNEDTELIVDLQRLLTDIDEIGGYENENIAMSALRTNTFVRGGSPINPYLKTDSGPLIPTPYTLHPARSAIDYSQDPVPPLSEDDAAWANAL
jgi:hypothetical protein